MKFLSRKQWNARPPKTGIKAIGKVSEIFIHHSVTVPTADPANDVQWIQKYHMDSRNYTDIAYTLLVHPDGTILEGRTAGEQAAQGAHTLGHNSTAIGICAIGNYENIEATDQLVAALNEAIGYAQAKGWTTAKPKIRPHKAVSKTACCGKNLVARLEELGGTPVTPPAPGPAPAPPANKIPPFPGTTRRGSRGEAVRQTQARLAERGWIIVVDGIFGTKTDKTVKQFQAEKKLVVDGIVGPKTWSALWTSPIT